VELRVNLSLWQFLGILIASLIVSSALLFGLVGGVWLVLQTLRALAFLVYAPLQWTWRKTTYRPRHLTGRERIEDIEEISLPGVVGIAEGPLASVTSWRARTWEHLRRAGQVQNQSPNQAPSQSQPQR
jgi:hypothetical protein